MSDASLDFCERCDQPTYARALHDGVCDNCNPVPFLRARIAELEEENERLRPVVVPGGASCTPQESGE
jgi:hypothetical protein